jgi:pyruvate/2-oxoglutarate dehydrogenase complex dihydrolipoamide acyltransferase (E2) component
MDRTVRRLVRGLGVALVLVLAQACGNGGGEDDRGQGTAAQAPPAQAPRTSAAKPAARAPAPKPVHQKLAASGATDQVRAAVRERVSASGRKLELEDPRSGETLELVFDFVHAQVNSTAGGRYVVCTGFHTQGGTPYDVDYYVRAKDGKYLVEDVVMHKADRTAVLSDEQRTQLDRAS